MIVTTAEKPDAALVVYARRLADELGCRFAERRRETLAGLARKFPEAAHGILIAGPQGLRYAADGAEPLFYHPSMALIRVKRLLEGGHDALVDATGVRTGDAIVDCTAGLGADALVLSYAAGAAGSVTAVEASRILYVIVREGLRAYASGLSELDEAMRRVKMEYGEHLRALRAMPDRSADIVYFDPMFAKPVPGSASLRPLRAHAEDRSLAVEAIGEARRVARRIVVLKDHKTSGEFERHGFRRVRTSYSAVDYGVIEIQ
ncbi:class I SAM-dependent methyltransferase [Cohnella hashimotonis]|uniref:Class I SAM-dependent methyltransferase n=1 Tax=Cohnella hashimotonis TaxID=2826895 RepID=A0ABT6TFL1_9BACL|nr:class I SAM-dependent methyltransferase [Cohnella hashimotonis]MDI4645611.1 class I SAM-dependent methyltransferase [Cohnella hashimotonis]